MTEQQRSLYTRWRPHPWHGLASGADARRVVGGLKLIDRGEADGKILAVLEGDYVWGKASEIDELPPALADYRDTFGTG
jgi:inorganic pyrophosphatase